MNITDIRLKRIEGAGNLKAVASITIDGEFVVHDIKVIQSENGLFLAMPSRRKENGGYADICHPITSDARNAITKAILDMYEHAPQEQPE